MSQLSFLLSAKRTKPRMKVLGRQRKPQSKWEGLTGDWQVWSGQRAHSKRGWLAGRAFHLCRNKGRWGATSTHVRRRTPKTLNRRAALFLIKEREVPLELYQQHVFLSLVAMRNQILSKKHLELVSLFWRPWFIFFSSRKMGRVSTVRVFLALTDKPDEGFPTVKYTSQHIQSNLRGSSTMEGLPGTWNWRAWSMMLRK